MEKVNQHNVDVKENLIREIYPELLELLLKDCTTKRNIIWATDDYSELGDGFNANDEITVDAITGANGNVIMPRSVKSKEKQGERTRNMAEVFTPTWICNKMNNLVDSAWFGKEGIFNIECNTEWASCIEKITFPNKNKPGIGSWMNYLAAKRLEITCGEAPYLVSRYNTVTGEPIPLEQRIGILDRKLRVINEKVRNFQDKDRAKKRWLQLAKLALQSTYGFEWQGDNVLLARENLLYTVVDYFQDKFSEEIAKEWLLELGTIIAWNIWQMDGIKCVVPDSCHDYKKPRKMVEPSLFDSKALSATTLKRSMSLCDVNEEELQKCQGCLKDNVDLHNGIYCKIKNWSNGKIYKFKDLLNKQESEVDMSKDFKFDVIIGNPPYQDSISTGDNASLSKQLFPSFVKNSILLDSKYIMLITPSRWFTADAQDKSFIKLREFIQEHNHIKCINHFANGQDVFPNVTVGAISYFLYDRDYQGNVEFIEWNNGVASNAQRPLFEEGLDIILSMNEMVSIIDKVRNHNNFKSLTEITYGRNAFGIIGKKSTLNAMSVSSPFPEAVKILCAYEEIRYTQRDNVTKNIDLIDSWKVFTSKGNGGAGNLNKEKAVAIIGKAFVGEPNTVCTDSLIPIGPFANRIEAENFKKYMTTKFLRFLVGVLKASQNITKPVYKFVPIQNFNVDSDINWDNDVAVIDQQLYVKYGLTAEEIDFIESLVKPME